MKRFLALLFAAGLTVCASAFADQITSEYSSTKTGVSVLKPTNEPGGDSSKIRCKGYGGYEVMLCDGDSRSWLNVVYGKTEIDLYAGTSEVKSGDSFFNKSNDVVEWRGAVHNGKFMPYAIIYRLSGITQDTQKSSTRLIVIHLDKENTKVVGYAQGKNEDAEAKQIADRYKP